MQFISAVITGIQVDSVATRAEIVASSSTLAPDISPAAGSAATIGVMEKLSPGVCDGQLLMQLRS